MKLTRFDVMLGAYTIDQEHGSRSSLDFYRLIALATFCRFASPEKVEYLHEYIARDAIRIAGTDDPGDDEVKILAESLLLHLRQLAGELWMQALDIASLRPDTGKNRRRLGIILKRKIASEGEAAERWRDEDALLRVLRAARMSKPMRAVIVRLCTEPDNDDHELDGMLWADFVAARFLARIGLEGEKAAEIIREQGRKRWALNLERQIIVDGIRPLDLWSLWCRYGTHEPVAIARVLAVVLWLDKLRTRTEIARKAPTAMSLAFFERVIEPMRPGTRLEDGQVIAANGCVIGHVGLSRSPVGIPAVDIENLERLLPGERSFFAVRTAFAPSTGSPRPRISKHSHTPSHRGLSRSTADSTRWPGACSRLAAGKRSKSRAERSQPKLRQSPGRWRAGWISTCPMAPSAISSSCDGRRGIGGNEGVYASSSRRLGSPSR